MMKRAVIGVLVCAFGLTGLVGTAAAQGRRAQVRAFLHGGNETPPVSPATGSYGSVVCEVDVDAETAACAINFYNLPGGITASHIHAGVTGANGPVVCDAVPSTPLQASGDGRYTWTCNSSVFRPNAGAGIRTMRDLMEAILGGVTYFNIHTNERAGGEIRGPLCPESETHNVLTGVSLCTFGDRR